MTVYPRRRRPLEDAISSRFGFALFFDKIDAFTRHPLLQSLQLLQMGGSHDPRPISLPHQPPRLRPRAATVHRPRRQGIHPAIHGTKAAVTAVTGVTGFCQMLSLPANIYQVFSRTIYFWKGFPCGRTRHTRHTPSAKMTAFSFSPTTQLPSRVFCLPKPRSVRRSRSVL